MGALISEAERLIIFLKTSYLISSARLPRSWPLQLTIHAFLIRIKESEEKYRNLVEDIEDVIFRVDKTGRYLFLNKALQKVTGYFPQEFYDTPSLATDMIHKDDEKLVRETMQKILDDELNVSKDLEYRVYCKNGKELWLSQNTYPIKNKNGSIIGVEGIIRDITVRKR